MNGRPEDEQLRQFDQGMRALKEAADVFAELFRKQPADPSVAALAAITQAVLGRALSGQFLELASDAERIARAGLRQIVETN